MVVDIQGVKEDNEFRLTDPALHCMDKRFGPTNFQRSGMVVCLEAIEHVLKTGKPNSFAT